MRRLSPEGGGPEYYRIPAPPPAAPASVFLLGAASGQECRFSTDFLDRLLDDLHARLHVLDRILRISLVFDADKPVEFHLA